MARSGALVCSLVLVGALRITVETQVLSPNDLRLIAPEEAVIASVRGRIVTPPELRRVGSEERIHLQVELSSIRLDEAWHSASGKILITSVSELASTYSSGKAIEVDGVLRQPASAVSPDFYDRRKHLARRGIYREMQTDDFSQWAVTPETVSLTRSECAPKQWLKSLRKTGVPVFSVREQGGLRLIFRNNGWSLENARDVLFSWDN